MTHPSHSYCAHHTHVQTYLDGRPLLSLPARTIAWVPVERLSASEKFVYSYLEVLAAKECARLVEQVRPNGRREGGWKAHDIVQSVVDACISWWILTCQPPTDTRRSRRRRRRPMVGARLACGRRR